MTFGDITITSTQYADDLKLFAWEEDTLTTLFREVKHYLSVFSLTTSAAKAFVLHIGTRRSLSNVLVDECRLDTQPYLRFLGVMITGDGRFAPWRDSYDSSLHALHSKLRNVGLGRLPAALTNGIFISIIPSLLFGCEVWGIEDLFGMLFKN